MKLFMNNRRKKASLQLSINAIVILVMAMAVLGIGLSLIRGVLGQGKNKLGQAIEELDIGQKATSEEPLVGINSLKVQRNKESIIGVNFYNSGTDACASAGAELNITCNTDDETDFWKSKQTLPIKVNIGDNKDLGGIFVTEQISGKYICEVSVECGGEPVVSEQSFLEVTS